MRKNAHAEQAIRQQQVVEDVLEERDRQDDQWGVQNHHPAYWLAILGKQVGQFGSAVLDREWREGSALMNNATKTMRDEAVQLTAVGLAIIEAIDRGEMPVGVVTAKPEDPRQLARALGRGDESLDYDREPAQSPICPCSTPKTTHRESYHDETWGVGTEPCS